MVKSQKAFSLVEALVATTILITILVFVTAASTKKAPKENQQLNSFRCFCAYTKDASGVLTLERQSRYVTNGRIITDTYNNQDDKCVFFPPVGTDIYTIKVWNNLAQDYDPNQPDLYSLDYAVTSFSKKEIEVVLGNNEHPSISVEDAFSSQQIETVNRCYNDMTKEECINDSDDNTNWISDLCMVHFDEKADTTIEQQCNDAGSHWLDDNQISNPCNAGVNVEINW